MKWDRYFHILRFLHIIVNNEPAVRDKNSDWLWKMINLFEFLNKKFSKFYGPSGHLAVDEFIFNYEGRVIFRQYILKKHTFRDQHLQTM